LGKGCEAGVLVLSRKLNESLVIGDNIVITVLSVEHDQVKLGIEAPRDIRIARHEIYVALNEQTMIEDQLSLGPASKSFEKLRSVLIQLADPAEDTPTNDQSMEIKPDLADSNAADVEPKTKISASKKQGKGKLRNKQANKK
jgi:carbon storage regulator